MRWRGEEIVLMVGPLAETECKRWRGGRWYCRVWRSVGLCFIGFQLSRARCEHDRGAFAQQSSGHLVKGPVTLSSRYPFSACRKICGAGIPSKEVNSDLSAFAAAVSRSHLCGKLHVSLVFFIMLSVLVATRQASALLISLLRSFQGRQFLRPTLTFTFPVPDTVRFQPGWLLALSQESTYQGNAARISI